MTKTKTAFILSAIIVLAVVASIGGLLLKDLYRDVANIKMAWYGNDAVTLFIVVPIMVLSLKNYFKKNVSVHLVWLGCMLYMFYNYAFYLLVQHSIGSLLSMFYCSRCLSMLFYSSFTASGFMA